MSPSLSGWRRALLLAAAIGLVQLSGCGSLGTSTAASTTGVAAAASPAPPAPAHPADPWEQLNRRIFQLNDSIDRKFVAPLAQAYKKFVPALVIQGIDNVLSNASDVWSAANHMMQGKPQEALETGLRFGVNTVFGLGGLLDIASEMGLERRREDFGQTLGVWGVGPGPYLVLPLLGPSTVRDGLALPLDRSTDLGSLTGASTAGSAALTFGEIVHNRASLLNASSLVGQIALDRYTFIRDSYLARRRSVIYDGNPPPEPEEPEPAAGTSAEKPK